MWRMTDGCSCEQVADRTADYLAHALPAVEQELIDRHVAGCPQCRMSMTVARAVRELRGGPAADLDLQQRLSAVFRAWQDEV